MKQLRRRLTYANVMSSIAVFLVLGGATAFAASHLGKNSVGTKQLKNNAVTAAKVKGGAINGSKLAGGAVTTDKLGDGSVTSGKLANGAVTGDKIANGSVTNDKLATQFLPASTIGVPVAGVNVSASGEVQKFFNRAGGAPTVEKIATGIYILKFPGLIGQAYFNNSIAMAALSGAVNGEISRTSSSGNPYITTYNSAGTPTDESFEFVLFVSGPEL